MLLICKNGKLDHLADTQMMNHIVQSVACPLTKLADSCCASLKMQSMCVFPVKLCCFYGYRCQQTPRRKLSLGNVTPSPARSSVTLCGAAGIIQEQELN